VKELRVHEKGHYSTSVIITPFIGFTNIWSLSFDRPELFNSWHVGIIAEDAERALADNKNYVAILPRFHFKSTLLGHGFSVWRLLKATRDTSILYLSYSDTMARYHISEINKTVQRNPVLMEMLTARNTRAEFQFRYPERNCRRRQGSCQGTLHSGQFRFGVDALFRRKRWVGNRIRRI